MSDLTNDPNYVVEKFYSQVLKESLESYDTQHSRRLVATLAHLNTYNIKEPANL